MSRTTLPALLRATGMKRADAVALRARGRGWTYAQLWQEADAIEARLRRAVRAGECVVLAYGNDPEYLPALLGTMAAGAVAVPLNVKLGPDALRHVARDCGARSILHGPSHADLPTALDLLDPEDLPALATPSAATPTGDDLALQPYTSGSTGLPKGVPLTHAGQVWNATTVTRTLGFTAEDRALVAVPLFHANAMCGAVLPTLIAGGTLIVEPAFDADSFLASLQEHQATYTTGVPAMYRLLLERMNAPVASLRLAMIGSAPVTRPLLEAIGKAFPSADLVEGYGLTEAGPVVTLNPPGRQRLGSIGVPIDGCDVRLVDSGGGPVPRGEVGEIQVRNPAVTPGYHNLPDVTAARIDAGGWLSTGDLACEIGDGYLAFQGRRDDMLNVGGENVYPQEVERVLLSHPAVADAVVVAKPHQVKGQVPVAFVVTTADVSADELRSHALEHGPAYAHPREIHVLDAMPLASTGKVDRHALTCRAAAASLA